MCDFVIKKKYTDFVHKDLISIMYYVFKGDISDSWFIYLCTIVPINIHSRSFIA